MQAAVSPPSNFAGALQGRTITPPVHFDIGFSTANLIDEPVIGFGNDSAGEAPLPPAGDDDKPERR